MKKYILSALLALTTCITFGNTDFKSTKIADWDKPIVKTGVFTDPVINTLMVVRRSLNGYLQIAFGLSDWTDNRNWKATIGVRTWTKVAFSFPTRYDWVTMLYDIIVPPQSMNGSQEFYIPSYNQYSGYVAGSGDFSLYTDQYWVAYWSPM